VLKCNVIARCATHHESRRVATSTVTNRLNVSIVGIIFKVKFRIKDKICLKFNMFYLAYHDKLFLNVPYKMDNIVQVSIITNK